MFFLMLRQIIKKRLIDIFIRYKRLSISDIVANWDDIAPSICGRKPRPNEKKIGKILQSLERQGTIKLDQRRSIDTGTQEYVFLRAGNVVSLESKMMKG